MNQFTEAFAKSGVSETDNALLVALAKFFNYGGTIERCYALVGQATAELGRNGQCAVVRTALAVDAFPSPPMPEGPSTSVYQDQGDHANGLPIPREGHVANASGHIHDADARSHTLDISHPYNAHQGQPPCADIKPPLPEGLNTSADKGHTSRANGQPDASGEANPNLPAKAGQAVPPAREPNDAFRQALTRDRMQTAAIWLDRNKTSDGRYWSKVHPREFPGMERDAEVIRHIRLLYGEFSSSDLNKELGQILAPDMIKRLASRMEKYNAAH